MLRPTLIKEASGYLGPFQCSLEPDNTQFIIFQPNDDGPFWMSKEERETKWKDLVISNKMINQKLAKVELFLKLQEHSVIATGNITNIKKLCRECREKGIPLVETDIPKIQPGWQGKQKGMLQFLWEHGWINIKHVRKFIISNMVHLHISLDVGKHEGVEEGAEEGSSRFESDYCTD